MLRFFLGITRKHLQMFWSSIYPGSHRSQGMLFSFGHYHGQIKESINMERDTKSGTILPRGLKCQRIAIHYARLNRVSPWRRLVLSTQENEWENGIYLVKNDVPLFCNWTVWCIASEFSRKAPGSNGPICNIETFGPLNLRRSLEKFSWSFQPRTYRT